MHACNKNTDLQEIKICNLLKEYAGFDHPTTNQKLTNSNSFTKFFKVLCHSCLMKNKNELLFEFLILTTFGGQFMQVA